MLDIRLIREQPEFVKDGLKKLYAEPSLVDDVLRLDEERRAAQTEVDALKAERNQTSKQVAGTRDNAERQPLIARSKELGDHITVLDARVAEAKARLDAVMLEIPNLPDP
jgi:seryl-tRNA synthetase